MNQPDLGKKIAELRKAKGLTQEELVEKCNLNVRTLQRIESGEVTPRSYTIKTIFTALDYNGKDSPEFTPDKFRNTGFIISNWLEQLYRYVLDLFNLKTNTMKKISILSIMTTAIVFGITSLYNENNAQIALKSESSLLEKSISHDTIEVKNGIISGIYDGWNNDKEFVGRDIKCIINGVVLKSSLIRLDKNTNEFRTPCIIGILFKDKVKITNLKCQPTERIVNEVVISGNEYIYKSAKLVFSEEESIEASEIVISRE